MGAPGLLLGAALAAFGLFAWFVRLERAGQSIRPVVIVLWLLVLDSVLYSNQNQVPSGLFHPGIGADPNPTDDILENAISFRLVDIVIPMALAARLYAKGPPRRYSVSALCWIAFFGWLTLSGVIGLYNGNPFDLVSFEGKAVVYLGFFALAAGVPARDYVESRDFGRLIRGSALIAAAMILFDQSGVRVHADLPLVPLPSFGGLGADAASIFVALGVIALALGACSETGRLPLLFAAGPLFASALVPEQRAALLGTAVSILALAALVPFAWARLRATPTEIFLVLVVAAGVFTVPIFASSALGSSRPPVAFSKALNQAFKSRAKQLSAEARINQLEQARGLIAERPFTGWGLGKSYSFYDPGPKGFVTTNLTHNIGIDLLVRTGIAGLALFGLALGATLREGVRGWLHHWDDLYAALALAGVAIMAGLVAKGMVESVFEKYRLATMLGFVIGIVASAVAPAMRGAEARAADEKEAIGWKQATSSAL